MEQIVRRRAAWVLVATPVLLPFLAIALLGVDMLLWDEFFYVDFVQAVREGGSWLPRILMQHNEHRVVAMKLVMIPNALFLDWSRKAEMYFSAFLGILIVLGLWRLYRRSGGNDLLLFAPVAWLACSLAAYENLLYGMMTCHYFTVLGIVWALVCLDGPGPGRFAGAVLLGLLASYSIINGFLIWPAGLFLLLARGRRPAVAVAWLLAGVAAVALYLRNFQMPGGRPPLDISVATVAKMALNGLISLGAPLAAGSVSWGFVMGVLLSAVAAATLFSWWRSGRERLREQALPAALFLVGLLSTAMVAVGRTGMIPALQSRYIAYSSLAVIGAYLLLCTTLWRRRQEPGASPWFMGVLALLSFGLVAANLDGFDKARDWRQARLQERFLLQTFEQRTDAELASLYFNPPLRQLAAYLRKERLGPFSVPQDQLLLRNWREGRVLGEILPGRPVEQTLVCPVGELHDLAVPIATLGRPNTARVVLTVESEGRPIATLSVPASELPASGWTEIPMSEPLPDCEGREIRIRAESPDAVPGNAVSLWTYPVYYQGELRQGGGPVPDRALGLTLNGFHSGALQRAGL